MSFSNYLRDQLLNWYKGNTFSTAHATLYLRLHNGDPGRNGTSGTDVTNTVIGSASVAVASTVWGAITADGEARYISNSTTIGLGTGLAVETITHVSIWNDPTAGNFLGVSSAGSFVATIGAPLNIDVGALVVRMP